MFFFLRKKSFTLFLLILSIIAGLYSLNQIPREASPEIIISIINITTSYPGASPLDVEESITNVLENSLIGGIKNVKNIDSRSIESVSSITIEFTTDVDIREALSDVQNRVDEVSSDLPSTANEPLVQQLKFNDQPVYIFAMTSSQSLTALRKQADEIKEDITSVKNVSKVQVSGIPEREINIILDSSKLSLFALNANDISSAIRNSDTVLPPGSISFDERNYRLYLSNNILSIDDLGSIIIAERNGVYIFVRDVALRIEDGLAEQTSSSRVGIDNGPPQQAILFSIFKQEGGDITELVKNVEDSVQNTLTQENSEASFVTVYSAAAEIQKSLSDLVFSGLQTVLIVLIILSLGLGIREAIIAGIAIPLSFTIAFIGLPLTGSTINFLSLFSLILVIGILIDSAIVIVEGISDYMSEGMNYFDAAKKTLEVFAKPVVAGALTTISVFVPLLLLSGVTGQFIASIPKTIIIVLIASLFVALIFIPRIAQWFFELKFKEPEVLVRKRAHYVSVITRAYEIYLRKVLQSREYKKNIFITIAVLFVGSFALVGTGLIKSEFFPSQDPESLSVDIELPIQSTLQSTSLEVQKVENFIQTLDNVESYTTTVGSLSLFGGGGSGANVATISLEFPDSKYSQEIIDAFREYEKTLDTIDIKVIIPEGGPPVGDPVQIKFTGENLEELSRLTQEAVGILRSIPGTTEIVTSLDEGAVDIALLFKRDRLAQVGVTPFQLSQIINATLNGVDVTSLRLEKAGDVDVRMKVALNAGAINHTQTNHITYDELKTFPIQTPLAGEVLLGSLLEDGVRQASSQIIHEEGERVLTVNSQLLSGFVPRDIFSEFNKRANELEVPETITMTVGSESDAGAEAIVELAYTLLFGFLLVIAVLVWQFNSFRNTFIILSVVPLGLIGVLGGLFIFGLTLSFTAMLGFIALVGVVINDSIILVDVMETLRKEGDEDYVVKGSVSRLRPVILTTATTVFGMFPLLFVSQIWLPFAFAVITGLTFATVLTLLIIPILYLKFGRK